MITAAVLSLLIVTVSETFGDRCRCLFVLLVFIGVTMLTFFSIFIPVGVIVDLNEYEVNAIASLLKLYLRELPEPLIAQNLIPQFEAIAASMEIFLCCYHCECTMAFL